MNDFCISPGSRNTPLTLSVAQRQDLHPYVHFDERGAAFHALGLAKASGAPAVFICTSGSAVVNAMPAVVEASTSHTPLILLTADRPPELLDTGANQAIEQVKVFGDFVRWAHVFPCPDEAIPLESVLTAVCQGVYRATTGNPGPVHFNCMFREPLAPVEKAYTLNAADPRALARLKSVPFTEYSTGTGSSLELGAARSALEALRDTDRGLIVAGQLSCKADREAVAALAQSTGWPLLPDVTSGLRLTSDYGYALHHYHHLLVQGENACGLGETDTILHVGGPVVSKAFLEFASNAHLKAYLRVDGHPERIDAAHRASHRIEATPQDFATVLAGADLQGCGEGWRDRLTQASAAVERCIAEALDTEQELSEAGSVRLIAGQSAGGGALFLGNSMLIRDADMFGATDGAARGAYANRGASGIDGNIATAVGVAHATGRPVTAILGDLATLHDLSSLALMKKSETPVILVVINNDGGGIFSFLPVAEHSDHFEAYFGAPHGMNFRGHAEAFGLSYMQPQTRRDLAAAYAAAIEARDSAVIEIKTNRTENLEHHRELATLISEALAPWKD